MIAENFDDLFADIDINKLPTLPQILVLFLDAAHTEVVAFDRLSELIKQDASLTSRIVSAASSAYYGGQGNVLPLERILVMLGLETIKTIAITASVQQFFSRFDNASARRQKVFWRDSLTCAQLSSVLAHLTGYANKDEAYLAGLIHNIGSLIFSNNYHDQYTEIADLAESEAQLVALECEHFGGSRYQAGAWIVSSWGSDCLIGDAVLYQNEPVEELLDAHHLIKILAVASRLSQYRPDADAEGFAAALKLFDLNQGLVEELLEKARLEVIEIAESMDIDLGDLSGDSLGLLPSDEDKQVELAGKVREIALLNGVRQDLSHSDGELAVKHAIRKSLGILFNSKNSLFFKLTEQADKLVGDPLGDDDQQIAEIEVGLQSANSLIGRCFVEKRVLNSLPVDSSAPASVLDRQLLKMTHSKHFVCLPLILDQHAMGVLVVGITAKAASQVDQQLQLWKMFANEASYSLFTQLKHKQQQQQQHDDDCDYFQAKAREIVHEVNNPLSIVKNYVHILSSRIGENDAVKEELQIIRDELDRAGNILLQLPGIAGHHVTADGTRLVDINSQIIDLLKIFRSSLFATTGVEAVTDLDSSMVAIESNPSAIKQILTNLIKNAAEALPASGQITIETQALVNLNGRNYVEIVIADNGPGMPSAVQEKLFTPVETTKGGGHAGLGLSIVKHLIDELEGSVSCRSSAKNGTRFEILIPRITEETE